MFRQASPVAKAIAEDNSSTPGQPGMPITATPTDALLADRYLKAAGISVPSVRADIVRESLSRLEYRRTEGCRRVFDVRVLAAVERVLCDRLGAEAGSNTTNPDTARRRLLFSINPTYVAQIALLRSASVTEAVKSRNGRDLVRIPEIADRKHMPRQSVDFAGLPWLERPSRSPDRNGPLPTPNEQAG